MRSLLLPDGAAEPLDQFSRAGAAWRAWVGLVAAGDLPPLLRSGSTGPQAAGSVSPCISLCAALPESCRRVTPVHCCAIGYLLKSVEKMFAGGGAALSGARLQGALCWRAIVDSIVTLEVAALALDMPHRLITSMLLYPLGVRAGGSGTQRSRSCSCAASRTCWPPRRTTSGWSRPWAPASRPCWETSGKCPYTLELP